MWKRSATKADIDAAIAAALRGRVVTGPWRESFQKKIEALANGRADDAESLRREGYAFVDTMEALEARRAAARMASV